MNNPAPQIIDLPEPQAAPAADPLPRSRSGHTRTGKIARLPKAIRDQLDQMLEDGATVDQIKDTLGGSVRDISPNSFSEWKKGGHLDWRKDQFWRQEMRLRQEAFTDILEGADPVKLPEAGLQVTTTAICDLLRDLCEADTDDQKTRVEKHVRIANAMSRLARSILQLQQYREAGARDKAVELKQRDINEDLTDNEYEILTARMDQVFRRPRKKPADGRVAVPPALRSLGEGGAASDAGVPPASPPPSAAAFPVAEAPIPNAAPLGINDSSSSSFSSSPPVPVPSQAGPTGGRVPLPLAASQRSEDGAASDSSISPLSSSPPAATSPEAATTGVAPAAASVKVAHPEPPAAACAPSSFIPHPSSFPPERCLECSSPLPPILPDGTRPRPQCDNCNFELPPPGSCVEPTIEQCQVCFAKLPRLLPNGHRPLDHCHHCSTALPPPPVLVTTT